MTAERGFGIKQTMENHTKSKGITFSFVCNFNFSSIRKQDENADSDMFKCPFRINYQLHREQGELESSENGIYVLIKFEERHIHPVGFMPE
jgi:hypothetical protein